MPKKYHIHLETVEPRFHPIGKYTTVEFREDCAGSCKACVKKKCVYGVFNENYVHMSSMHEPEYLYTCQSCFRCVQECTKGIFSRVINPDYRSLGDEYWRPDVIHKTWYQAHTGKIPVSGAGYRGPFVGEGFDSMWTDMSEIVRPTRDGIHGREYINTSFELSRRVGTLEFDADGALISDLPNILEIPIPLLLELPEDLVVNESTLMSAAMAAQMLGTMMFIPMDTYFRFARALDEYSDHLIPVMPAELCENHWDTIYKSRAVEITYGTGMETVISRLREKCPDLIICVGLPLDPQSPERALELAGLQIDTLHFRADPHGKELGADKPRFLKEKIREIHLFLVENSIRQNLNMVFGGGIAMPEHMAKAVICGADGIVADYALMLALECRLCRRCVENLSCPVKLDQPYDTDWGCQRIVNLIGAWHNQLIEVMGAMGIREVRRLRGEVGRSMWFEDLEKESFEPIFGKRQVAGLG